MGLAVAIRLAPNWFHQYHIKTWTYMYRNTCSDIFMELNKGMPQGSDVVI